MIHELGSSNEKKRKLDKSQKVTKDEVAENGTNEIIWRKSYFDLHRAYTDCRKKLLEEKQANRRLRLMLSIATSERKNYEYIEGANSEISVNKKIADASVGTQKARNEAKGSAKKPQDTKVLQTDTTVHDGKSVTELGSQNENEPVVQLRKESTSTQGTNEGNEVSLREANNKVPPNAAKSRYFEDGAEPGLQNVRLESSEKREEMIRICNLLEKKEKKIKELERELEVAKVLPVKVTANAAAQSSLSPNANSLELHNLRVDNHTLQKENMKLRTKLLSANERGIKTKSVLSNNKNAYDDLVDAEVVAEAKKAENSISEYKEKIEDIRNYASSLENKLMACSKVEIKSLPVSKGKKDKWTLKFDQLREYRAINKDTKVSYKKDKNDPYLYFDLGRWVRQQRIARKDGKLDHYQILRLDSLDFDWGKLFSTGPSWDEHFKQLSQLYNEEGHCNVLMEPDDPTTLARWVSLQRIEYKRYIAGIRSILSNGKIAKLNEISFDWNGQSLYKCDFSV